MINFRFHLVSLTGVFLALALGIFLGVAVIDTRTVNFLEDRITAVRASAREARDQRDQHRAALQRWERFAEEAGDTLVEGRLAEVPVVLIAVDGVDRTVLTTVRDTLVNAGGRLAGTLWFTSKLGLANPDDASALMTITGIGQPRADSLRRATAAQTAAALAGAQSPEVLAGLQGGGFLEVEAPPGAGAVEVTSLAGSGFRFMVVSGPRATVSNAHLAVPFVLDLARQADARVLAAESPGGQRAPEGEDARFVGPLRASDTGARLATVDDITTFVGRLAGVLALQDLGAGRVGHYGVGEGASRIVPSVAR